MISRKYNNKSNVVGSVIEKLRKSQKMSRETLSNKLMMLGIDINRDGIYKIEIGKRIIKDFELSAFSIVLDCEETEILKDFKVDLITNRSFNKIVLYLIKKIKYYFFVG